MRTLLVLAALLPSMALAQTQPTLQQQFNQLMGSKKGQSNIGQVLAVGTLLGCTQKQAGKAATDAFYNEMQTIGKTVESYCKQGHPTEARALVMSTVTAKHKDPVVLAAVNCYDTNKENLHKMAGPKIAGDAERYASWIKDPAAAQRDVKETDICRNSLKTAAPVPEVN